MTRQRRRYSDEDRAAALATLDANGGNLSGTARQLGIPRDTLRRWAQGAVAPAVVQLHQDKKGQLAAGFQDFVARVLRLTTDQDIQAAALAARFTAAGIAVDKAQLLSDNPTAIVKDASEMTGEERRGRVAELLDRARARGNGTPPPV